MSFQYDSDDLGYESGYDLVCHSCEGRNPPDSPRSFINETDSPKVVYKCQMLDVKECSDPAKTAAFQEAEQKLQEANQQIKKFEKQVSGFGEGTKKSALDKP